MVEVLRDLALGFDRLACQNAVLAGSSHPAQSYWKSSKPAMGEDSIGGASMQVDLFLRTADLEASTDNKIVSGRRGRL